jgi:hypothetical protein
MFKSKQQKELEKKMALKKTMNEMNKQIKKLDSQKEMFIQQGKEALKKGLHQQVNLAVSGLRMTLSQKKKVESMLLNLKITSQMKDVMMMTTEFLGAMTDVSKEMNKLTNEKQFMELEKQFAMAMSGAEMQSDMLDSFLDNTDASFESYSVDPNDIKDEEVKALIFDDVTEGSADESFEAFKKAIIEGK